MTDYEIKEKQIANAERLLAQHGFKIEIFGCGCCGSPSVRLTYHDEPIIGDPDGFCGMQERVNIDMFKKGNDTDAGS